MTTATKTRTPRTTKAAKAAEDTAMAAAMAAAKAAEAKAAEDAADANADAGVEPTLEELIMQVKQNWMLANDAESIGKKGVQEAKKALDATRVLKSRVAFHAGVLGSRAHDGAPSHKGATRVLYCTADMSASEVAKQVENKKASVRLYWAAAKALDAEGLAHETGAPTETEMEIVLQAFRDGKKKAPRPDDGGNGEGEGEGEGGAAKAPETVDVTADSFLPFIAGLNATLTAVKAKKVPVSEEQAAEMVALMTAFGEQLTAYVNG